MLYSIDTNINEIIKRTLNGKAVAIIDPGKSYELVYPFVQCHETKTGLIVSAGYDEYMPSSAMHMIYGDINVDPLTEQITVSDDRGLKAVIREATRVESRTHEAYLGENSKEDQDRVGRHTRLIASDAKNFNKEQSL
jgi:hypothetical protein